MFLSAAEALEAVTALHDYFEQLTDQPRWVYDTHLAPLRDILRVISARNQFGPSSYWTAFKAGKINREEYERYARNSNENHVSDRRK